MLAPLGSVKCHLPARVGIKANHIVEYPNQHSGEGKRYWNAHQGGGQAVSPAGVVVPGMLQAMRGVSQALAGCRSVVNKQLCA